MRPAEQVRGTDAVVRLDDVPDGLVVADAAGRVVALNAVARRLAGLGSAPLAGAQLADVLALHDLEGQPWHPPAGPDAEPVNPGPLHSGEELLLLPGGREVLVTVHVASTPQGEQTVVSLRANDRDRAQADLISTVAHELRSPLTSVKGFTATLLARWERFTDEQKRLMLETVNADADRVTRLITELLDISRIDAGRLELRRQVVDLPATVERHVERLVAAGLPPERFTVAVQPGLTEVWADPDKLDQVLANLLENAVTHGDGHVTVTVQPAELDGEPAVAVSVADEGEGIPADFAARVFTKFWRGTRRGGTGLGLYIVRGLVEAHGGRVELEPAAGGGALFRFVLPGGEPEVMGFRYDDAL